MWFYTLIPFLLSQAYCNLCHFDSYPLYTSLWEVVTHWPLINLHHPSLTSVNPAVTLNSSPQRLCDALHNTELDNFYVHTTATQVHKISHKHTETHTAVENLHYHGGKLPSNPVTSNRVSLLQLCSMCACVCARVCECMGVCLTLLYVLESVYLVFCERGNTGQLFIWYFYVRLWWDGMHVHVWVASGLEESGWPDISKADIFLKVYCQYWIPWGNPAASDTWLQRQSMPRT